MAGQMIGVLSLSLTLLLTVFATQEILKQQTIVETAESTTNLNRIKSLIPIFTSLNNDQIENIIPIISSCHRGYSLTNKPYASQHASDQSIQLQSFFRQELSLNNEQVLVGHAILLQHDFSYSTCKTSEMKFPVEAMVISIKLTSDRWLNLEIHPHEWHIQDILYWIKWSGIAFVFIGSIAIFFISHLNKPLENLSRAAEEFAQGLNVSKVKESGPPDIRRTIKSFNAMQQHVADEVRKRTETLAEMSHDIRTPLTALRIKTELIEDKRDRKSILSSINKMEKITNSALEFLKGENRFEPMRVIDLSELLKSDCLDFSEKGDAVSYIGESNIIQLCRPEALARAVRNLIENAVKYAGSATINLTISTDFVTILIIDNGPGIPKNKRDFVVQPFKRLSKARESQKGGFGLGLAIVKAIAQGHNADLTLYTNVPTGLIAKIKLHRSHKNSALIN